MTAEEIRRPQDVEVVQVVPSQVHLAFDTRLTREVEIHPRVTGTFITGLGIAKVEVDPEWITITGPRHHVERVDSATTDPVVLPAPEAVDFYDECVRGRSPGAGGAADFDSRDGGDGSRQFSGALARRATSRTWRNCSPVIPLLYRPRYIIQCRLSF